MDHGELSFSHIVWVVTARGSLAFEGCQNFNWTYILVHVVAFVTQFPLQFHRYYLGLG